jgi:hypothetical protein
MTGRRQVQKDLTIGGVALCLVALPLAAMSAMGIQNAGKLAVVAAMLFVMGLIHGLQLKFPRATIVLGLLLVPGLIWLDRDDPVFLVEIAISLLILLLLGFTSNPVFRKQTQRLLRSLP